MDNQAIKDLTLLLLYLTSWEEKQLDETALRSWKGYNFEILNELEDADLIFGSKRSKSVHLSQDGIDKAKEIIKNIIFKNQQMQSFKSKGCIFLCRKESR